MKSSIQDKHLFNLLQCGFQAFKGYSRCRYQNSYFFFVPNTHIERWSLLCNWHSNSIIKPTPVEWSLFDLELQSSSLEGLVHKQVNKSWCRYHGSQMVCSTIRLPSVRAVTYQYLSLYDLRCRQDDNKKGNKKCQLSSQPPPSKVLIVAMQQQMR